MLLALTGLTFGMTVSKLLYNPLSTDLALGRNTSSTPLWIPAPAIVGSFTLDNSSAICFVLAPISACWLMAFSLIIETEPGSLPIVVSRPCITPLPVACPADGVVPAAANDSMFLRISS